ncbi:MAG: tRNA dihydrouridine synthase DusB [Planctomycetes bacterium]|nr:tRNA dihydrouridine synthase DusB [Planctomycetota bacterium]
MAGCTDLAYRRIARKFGCALAFCEMVKARAVIEGNERTRAMLVTDANDHPLGMQLLGRDPALLAEAARRIEARGADVIDLNLGCPVNKVVKEQCGSALLKEPDQVGRILDAMVAAVRVPVTIKMRTGFEEGDDERFLAVARTAQASGAAAITAHGRTRTQLYRGMSNHEAIRRVKEAVSIPVFGNGDIRGGEDAARMVRATGCDGVMVARGALGYPWIYEEVRAALSGGARPPKPRPPERAAVLAEHFELMRSLYGDVHACLRARRVAMWYICGVTGGAELRRRAGRIETPADVKVMVAELEARGPAESDAGEPAEAA